MSSIHPETYKLAKAFEANAASEVRLIQRSLRDKTFEFKPQKGVLKDKSSGGQRGIVVGPIPNRIVERSILECLMEEVPFVQGVLNTVTSVGGVPDRGVGHGLYLIREALLDEKACYIRSDISDFFGSISQEKVLEVLGEHIDDETLGLIRSALEVTLINERELGENRKVFPVGSDGVAQGSPLSALMGNILLHEFDKKFNDRGVSCIRFIDDFVLIGPKSKVRPAFISAKKYLADLGLSCHDPYEASSSELKTQKGWRRDPFIFLGYEITFESIKPCNDAKSRLVSKIKSILMQGKIDIKKGYENKLSLKKGKGCYIRVLDLVRKTIFGWGHAFAYATEPSPEIDAKLDQNIQEFNTWFKRYCEGMLWHDKRRALGVPLLSDIELKSLDKLPRKIFINTCRKSSGRLMVSTDGSRLKSIDHLGNDKGLGGWSAVFHCGGEIYGFSKLATNNEMELQAVVAAVENSPAPAKPLEVFTDSEYVYRVCASKKEELVKHNIELWEKLEKLSGERKFLVSKVKAHSGDLWNEKADELAKQSAQKQIAGNTLHLRV